MNNENIYGWVTVKVGEVYQYVEGRFVAFVYVIEDNSDDDYYRYKLKILKATASPLSEIFQAEQIKRNVIFYAGMGKFYNKEELNVKYEWMNKDSILMLNKEKINQIRIDFVYNNQHLFSLLADRDGTLNRFGNNTPPIDKRPVIGMTDGNCFKYLLNEFDETLFPLANIYDHPNKSGIPIKLTVAFIVQESTIKVFEFRYGSLTEDLGELLPYLTAYLNKSVEYTNDWYFTNIKLIPTQSLANIFNVVDMEEKHLEKKRSKETYSIKKIKKWWEFWK